MCHTVGVRVRYPLVGNLEKKMAENTQGSGGSGFGKLIGAAVIGAIVPTVISIAYISNLSKRIDTLEQAGVTTEAVAGVERHHRNALSDVAPARPVPQ